MNKITMDIWAVPDSEEEDGFRLTLMPPEKAWYMGEQDVNLGSAEAHFEPPENMTREQMAMKAVETLQARQKKIEADAVKKVNELQVRINQLRLLTHEAAA